MKKGRKVLIIKKTNPDDFLDSWEPCMDAWVGELVTVGAVHKDKGKVLLERDNGDCKYFPFTSLELVTTKRKPKKKTVEVDEDFVKKAYEAACSEWKDKIKEQFPDMFPPEYFDFSGRYTISTAPGGPLLIGHGIAPAGLQKKCLVVSNAYEMETTTIDGYTILMFKDKYQ
jgi:hypothetical protein